MNIKGCTRKIRFPNCFSLSTETKWTNSEKPRTNTDLIDRKIWLANN